MLRLLVYLVLLGVAVYLVFWVIDRRATGPGYADDESAGVRGERRSRRDGPLGPDDDEEFLRDLERRQRPPDQAGS